MIYITGDIHREQDIHKINPREFTVGNSLTENDYVIYAEILVAFGMEVQGITSG